MIKQIPVQLKGTNYKFYFNWADYKEIRNLAKKEGLSVEDYIYLSYAGTTEFMVSMVKVCK
jgi:hypothetical protein